jgi:hypothetical protein
MAQTIFGLEIKESWVEQMSPQLSGLPDQSWTNSTTGAVDTAVVEKVLGISREVRRSEHVRVKVPTSLSMATKGRQFRLHALYDHLCRYTHQTSKKRPLWRSWDLIQLNTACPSWAGQNSEAVLKCQAATPELREDIIERIKAAFAPLEKNAAKSSAIGHGALSSKGIEIAGLCGVAIICLERIQSWEQASEESRSAIAALVFSISTLLGREFLAAAFGVCEGMDRYFSACLAAWEVERNPPAVEEPLSTGSVDTLAYDGGLLDGPENAEVCPDLPHGMSLAQLYETVHKIAVMATSDPSNLLYIEQLEALIALNLPRIKESHSISEDATREVLTSCIAVIEKIGRTAIPGTFADEDFVYALNTAWLKHFDNLLCSAEANNATLTNAIETLIDSASDKLARLSKDKELRVEAEQQILSVAAAIVSAGFRERRELNAKKLELEAAMSTLRFSESISEEALIDALLPEWCPSADLMDGHDVELSLTAYTEGSRKALRGWHQQGEAVSQFAKVAFRNVDLAASAQSEEAEVEHSPNIKADGLVEIAASVFSETPPSSQASECIEAALLDENKQPLAVDPHSIEIATADEQQPDNASVIVQADELQVAPQSYEETAEWEEDDSPSDLITPGTPDVGLNHFLDIKGQATQRLIGCLNNGLNNYPAAVADNIAMHWLNEGQIPLAIKTLESASQIGAECYSLPIPLLSAAYHGMHVWRSDTSSVTRILRSMKGLSPEEIDYWMERRPGGRAIPYFVLAASLQPVMFAGNMTNAPRLLASMSSSYPDALRRLVDDLVKFTDRNHRLDLETLRSLPRSAESERRRDTTRKIEEWKDRIENKQTGWAPARNAMKNCLELPEFLLVISAIVRDDSSEQESVRSFTGKYRTHESQAALMSEQIARVLSEHYSSADIAGNARNWFLRTLDEVVSIADEWLESHESSHVQTGEVAKFARRFITQATTVVSTLTDELKGVSGLEKSVGLSIAIKTFRRILELADGQDWHRWEPRQIAGWLSWPREHLMEAGDDKPEQQLLSLCYMLEDGLDAEALARLALQNNNFRHAMLLTLHRQRDLNQDVGDTVAAIQLRFADYVHECGQRCQALTTLLDNAHVASLIDDQRHYQLRSEIDHIEEDLSRVEALDDMNATHLNLIELEADIKDKFDIKILEISTKLSELLGRARVEKGAGWVTQRWEEQFKSALDAKDTTIAEEMLEHLTNSLDNGKPLDEATEVAGPMFRELLNWTPILYPDLLTLHNPREVARTLGGIPKTAALAIQAMAPEDRSAIEGLIALRKAGVKTLDQSHYEMVINVLQGLGLDPVYKQYTVAMPRVCGFNTYGKFARMMLPVTSLETIRGIVFFTQEQLAREQMINVVVAGGEWNVRALGTMLSEQSFGHSDRTILLSGKPLSSEERNEFNTLCKQVRHTIYHVDPLLLTLLIGLPNGGDIRLKRFLQLSLPWTFANPYVGRQMQPAPVEMRYGRKDDLRQLLTMRNGAAIIFGGRQLGKTTLLSEAKRQFHNPIGRQHAYIQGMDGDMDRSELSRNRHEVATTKVWDTIFRSAVNAGLLEEPGSGTTTAEKIQRLRDYFQRDTAHSLMICLDEIDPILALDAANNFSIFREIRALMNESNGHFKVIIAGLENVRRFADAPNYPLTQMGSAIQVSIMNPPDALQLIREPLAYLGYEFESPLLMNRILVETNRHPGLIHIFCHELVKAKAANAKGKVGNVLITQSDIDLIRKDEAIHDIICERFDITLNLDQRYKLIAYSLINEGASSFSPSRAKSIVSYWAPETFSRMTEAQFEAFLDELCGLGILNKVRRIEGGKEYALRNSNILNLVGGRKKIEEKLLKAVEEIKDEDPMSGHAFPDGALRPSPLTIRDEKMIISEEEEKETREKPHRLARASNYSVGIIAGSEALGLRSQWLTESLPAIGLEERPLLDSKPMKYSAFQKKDTEFKTSDEFRSYLIEGPLHQAKHHPLMLFIELTGMRPLSFTLDLLDIAQELRADASGKRHRVRVLFLMGPTVLWQWVSNPRLTAAREQMQPFADLDIWKRTALIHLINKVGLDNTSSSLDMLQQYSQGWYYSIDRLLAAVSSKPDMKMIDGFGAAYSPLLSAKQRSLGEFLTLAGLPTDSWGRQVLASLCSQDSFDLEDFELQLIELDLQIDPTIAIAWLVRLRLIHPVNKAGKNGIYTICETVRTGLKVLVA